jgi:hypothetical protein
MHYCSEEVESSTAPHSLPSSTSHTPHRSRSPVLFNTNDPWYWYSPPTSDSTPYSQNAYELELEEQLEDSLEELEDGIDVLMILERAYQKTLDAHVVVPSHVEESSRATLSANSSSPSLSCSAPSSFSIPSSLRAPTTNPITEEAKKPVPLLAGSSTVLLAVLDHVPRPTPANDEIEPTHVRGLKPSASTRTEYDAVIKVAHVGDCMGMLVRGEEVVWRSEEMWWSVCPYLLSPFMSTVTNDLSFLVQHTRPTRPIIIRNTHVLGTRIYSSCRG